MRDFQEEDSVSSSRKYSPANPPTLSLDMNAVSAPPSLLSQPIPVDTNGDLKIDLFGAIPSTSSSGPFKIWSNVWNSSDPQSEIFEMYVVYAHVLCGRIEHPLCLELNQSWRGLSASCPIHIAMLLLTWTEIVLLVNTYSNLLHEQCVI